MDAGSLAGLDLAVVIVSFNVRELLRECLRSVREELGRQKDLRAAVWVVDNASHDGSADMVRTEFPDVHLIANDANRGFAAANNQALRALGLGGEGASFAGMPRFVLLLNPDTTLEAGALTTWLAAAEALPRAGVLGPALRYPDGQFQHSAFAFPTLWQVFFDFFPLHYRLLESRLNGRYPRRWYQSGRPFPIGHPLGAAMLARGEAVQGTGLLDEGYFIYAEEVDWCLRMRACGWERWCVPAARVIHHEAQSTRQFRDEMFVHLWRSRFRLFAKHYSPLFNAAVRPLVRLGLRRLSAEARRARQAGQLDEAGCARRLSALEEVRRMSYLPPERFR
jgi:hypothetical protein